MRDQFPPKTNQKNHGDVGLNGLHGAVLIRQPATLQYTTTGIVGETGEAEQVLPITESHPARNLAVTAGAKDYIDHEWAAGTKSSAF